MLLVEVVIRLSVFVKGGVDIMFNGGLLENDATIQSQQRLGTMILCCSAALTLVDVSMICTVNASVQIERAASSFCRP